MNYIFPVVFALAICIICSYPLWLSPMSRQTRCLAKLNKITRAVPGAISRGDINDLHNILAELLIFQRTTKYHADSADFFIIILRETIRIKRLKQKSI